MGTFAGPRFSRASLVLILLLSAPSCLQQSTNVDSSSLKIARVPGCDSSGKSSARNPHCNATPPPSSGSGKCATRFGNQVDAISQGTLALNICAIREGKVKCWGENLLGQLGLGDINTRGDESDEMGSCLSEIDLGEGSDVTSIAVSNTSNRCALLADGSVKCWGLNSLGQLGLGDHSDRVLPQDLGNALPRVDLGTGLTATQLVAGNRHYCALLSDGGVKCWGAFTGNVYFAPNPGFVGDAPGEMGDALAYVNLPAGRTAKRIATGSGPTCAVLDDDSLYCWYRSCVSDSSDYTGPTFTCTDLQTNAWVPVGAIPVGFPAPAVVQDVTLGTQFACALSTQGQVKCWGANSSGQLGRGDTLHRGHTQALIGEIASLAPVDLGSGRTALKLSAGSAHVCALLDNGDVKCWGENLSGQLGLGDTSFRGDQSGEMGDHLPAVNLGAGRKAIDIAAGVNQTCALLDDHTLKCWGDNRDGRLGQGDLVDRGTTPESMGDALAPISLW